MIKTVPYDRVVKVSVETQAGTSIACQDKGIQVNRPDIVYEDLQDRESDAKMRFYTGLP